MLSHTVSKASNGPRTQKFPIFYMEKIGLSSLEMAFEDLTFTTMSIQNFAMLTASLSHH